MDDPDLKLLGSMFRWQVCRPSGWDPRISVRQLAEQADLPRSTAWERLNAWKEEGFFQGCYVLPNPLVVGGRMASYRIRMKDAAAKPALLEAVRLMDGSVGGIDLMGEEVILNFVGDSIPALERKAGLMSQMASVSHVQGPMLFPSWEETPPRPDDKDVAMMAHLLQEPDVDVGQVAERLGMTERTAKRRYGELIKNRQLLFRPHLEYGRLPGTTCMVAVHFEHDRPEKELGMELLRTMPGFIPFCDPFEQPDGSTVPLFIGLARYPNPVAFEPDRSALLNMDGVTKVELLLPVRTWVETGWFRERMDALAP